MPLYLKLLFGFVLFGFVAAQFALRYIFGKKIKMLGPGSEKKKAIRNLVIGMFLLAYGMTAWVLLYVYVFRQLR